jgi:hypothetical protein
MDALDSQRLHVLPFFFSPENCNGNTSEDDIIVLKMSRAGRGNGEVWA